MSYRKQLLAKETEHKEKVTSSLKEQLEQTKAEFDDLNIDDTLKEQISDSIRDLITLHEEKVRTRVQRKLATLYGGAVTLPNHKDCFINLSDYDLTSDQKDLLNLGLNCHFLPKHSQQLKRAELELLYQQICDLHKQDKIVINPDLQEQLQAESTKRRGSSNSAIITSRLRRAAKELRENPNIVVRRADKASIFVVLNKADYISKVESVLSDSSKFQKITRNPVEQQKAELNRLIDAANAAVGGIKFDRITGSFDTGYFYGNIKSHKPGYPIRPIISQIPTPCYQIAKRLNSLIAPYIPSTYSLKSADEFVQILKSRGRQGTLASLDVQSLFTNVPIDETITIILDDVFSHPILAPPAIPREILKRMLEICTKKSPFRCPLGNLYYQVDGVAMGSPLGVLFAEAYMTHIEIQALEKVSQRPFTYCRYIDDVFVDVQSDEHLQSLREELENTSILRFTTEKSEDNKLPFLDVAVDGSTGQYVTEVYRKPTNSGHCLNGMSECPERYKRSVVRAYIHRAFKHCSTWPRIHQELQRVRQLLADNDYSASMIEQEIGLKMQQQMKPRRTDETKPPGKELSIFYESQMTTAYKKDEKIVRDIVTRNCKPMRDQDTIRLVIYYRSPKVTSLVMKNNLSQDRSLMKMTNVVYQIRCTTGDCAHRPSTYIGHTTTTLSRRITMHMQDGGPKRHHETHDTPLTRELLVDNTTVLARCQSRRKLQVLEAIYIRDADPAINRQMNARGRLLLFDGSPPAARL